ncbi:hypothetical protein NW768_007545 [Fusarium equiseti]|uniref:Apple domain-containing protein n=1 Tax=Fusarium equiseti TaxID=61235 RepID=A0ABQ8R822_FUSEQ|nr:hypothetical protein NW768_007545 [Fusarium equiseti]
MAFLQFLAVAVALCCEVSASPCRPSSNIIVVSSTNVQDNVASLTVSSVLNSYGPVTTTIFSVIDNSSDGSSEGAATYELSTSTDSLTLVWTSVPLSSIDSDSPMTNGATTTTVLSSETIASQISSSSAEDETSTTKDTAFPDVYTFMNMVPTTETTFLATGASGTSFSQIPSTTEATPSIDLVDIDTITSGSTTVETIRTSSAEVSDITISLDASSTAEDIVNTKIEESSTVETSSIETSTIEINIIETTTAKASTSTTEEPTTSTSVAKSTGYFINGGFENPNDDGDYTGAPSLLGRSVTVKEDPSKALSGSRYAELAWPLVATGGSATYTFRQSVTGLDPTKRYAYTYNWAPVNPVMGISNNGYLKFTTYLGSTLYEFETRGEVSPTDQYIKRKIVFGGTPNMSPVDYVQTRLQPTGLTSILVRFDDISIVEYDPPCTLVSEAPNDKWCGPKGSVYGVSYLERMTGLREPMSLEDCAERCNLDQECTMISYVPIVGYNTGQCFRFKVPREELDFVQNSGGHYVYEMECFEFK